MTQLVHRTIDNFLHVLSDPVLFPQISLDINFDKNEIILVPSFQEIYGKCQYIIQNVSNCT